MINVITTLNNFIETSDLNQLYNWFHKLLSNLHLNSEQTHTATAISLVISFTACMVLLDYILKKILLVVIKTLIIKSKTKLDDILLNNKVYHNIVHLIPIVLSKIFFPIFFTGFPKLIQFTIVLTDVVLVIAFTLLINSIIRSIRDYIKTKPRLADKPLDSYSQVASIGVYFIAFIFIFSSISGKSPVNFLVSLGAASAILLLVFKDIIMGFVASIQVSANDMVRVGDWIEMSKFGADGSVLEINLSTVKVQNFDKTITTIPTHLLISDSFKNYRGMQSSGGRRIKRSINIKMSSIRFLELNEIEELKKIQLLKPYIEQRQKEIDEHNQFYQMDQTMPVNGRKMTNIGLFRAYILRYAEQNPHIHKDLALMVRHLQPTEHGLPIELYMFVNNTLWTFYENVMADLFDHLLASVSYFKLEVYELPSSDDVRMFLKHK